MRYDVYTHNCCDIDLLAPGDAFIVDLAPTVRMLSRWCYVSDKTYRAEVLLDVVYYIIALHKDLYADKPVMKFTLLNAKNNLRYLYRDLLDK